MKIFKNIFKRKEKQRTFCYCPKCNNELISSKSLISDDNLVIFKCTECQTVSEWLFETPVPILITYRY